VKHIYAYVYMFVYKAVYSRTWPLKVKNEVKLDKNEMSTIRSMCTFTQKKGRKIHSLENYLD